MVEGFEVTVVNRDEGVTLFVRGEIDLAAEAELRKVLLTAQQGANEVVVDLSNVTFCDSTGIGVFVRAHRAVPEGQFKVVGATQSIRGLFEMTGVAEYLLGSTDGQAAPHPGHSLEPTAGREGSAPNPS